MTCLEHVSLYIPYSSHFICLFSDDVTGHWQAIFLSFRHKLLTLRDQPLDVFLCEDQWISSGIVCKRILHPYVSATSVHYSLALKIPMQHVCSLLFLQEGSSCACILLCRRTCAACPFCCCTVILHNKLPYSPWYNERMKTSYDPADSKIIVSDFVCASSAPSILMHTRFLGTRKPRKGAH